MCRIKIICFTTSTADGFYINLWIIMAEIRVFPQTVAPVGNINLSNFLFFSQVDLHQVVLASIIILLQNKISFFLFSRQYHYASSPVFLLLCLLQLFFLFAVIINSSYTAIILSLEEEARWNSRIYPVHSARENIPTATKRVKFWQLPINLWKF